MRILKALVGIGLIFQFPLLATADIKLPRPSPRAEVNQQIGVTDLSVEYSSPGVKGRKVWGELVPYNELWRTGANMCTKFSTSEEIFFAGKKLPAGSYCLFTIPTEDDWTVVVNKSDNLPGTIGYDKKKDVLRAELEPTENQYRERMTFLFSDFDDQGGNLRLEWDRLALDIPIRVMTNKQVQKAIDTLNSKNWADYADSANYLLEQGKLGEALKYANKSQSLEKTWRNSWIKARILAKQEKFDLAADTMQEALQLGDNSPIFEFLKSGMKEDSQKWKSMS